MNPQNLRSNRRRNETLPPWESSQREGPFEQPPATWGTSTWVSSQAEGPSERFSVAWAPPTWESLQGEGPYELPPTAWGAPILYEQPPAAWGSPTCYEQPSTAWRSPTWISSHGEGPYEQPPTTWESPTWVSSQGEWPYEQPPTTWGSPSWLSSQGEGPYERSLAAWGQPNWASSHEEGPYELPSAAWEAPIWYESISVTTGLPTWPSSQEEESYEQPPAAWGTPSWVSSPEEGPYEQIQVPTVDFAENDDDVIETSSRDFAEAVANTRRTRRRIGHDSNMENQTMPTYNFMHERGSTSEVIENETTEPPPKEASIKCPICMNPSVEEMTTRCGHIFCKNCITTALTASRKCPTCGKGASKRGLVRVFLPSTRIIDEECMSIFVY
ncbi:hypothetical protein P8452_01677 [Trifolium repens]|nr:hypothetical protein P8452_01677 [Trifolium repens]